MLNVWTDIGNVPIAPVRINAGVPSNGTGGSFAGEAGAGDLLVDTTNAVLYQNQGTQASPTWTKVLVNPASVAITGGTIDGVAIGYTTPVTETVAALHVDTGTKTAAAVAGAATLNKMAGVITSESLVTAAGADYTLTLTNSDVAAADQVFASVSNGTNTGGDPALFSVAPAAGSVVIIVRNAHATAAFNGTIKVAFFVLKN